MLFESTEILQKPSIKKYYTQKMIQDYPLELIEFEQSILVSNVIKLQSIWSYISFDLIRNNIDFLEIVNLPITDNCKDWILQNIKVESFLNMIGTHYRKIGCINIINFIKDTFNQLDKLIERKIVVTPPKRWRMIEFHDHISYLYLQNTTKNNQLKTILKTPYVENEYTLSQPKDSISIIVWGKKVKNCVASYEERIGESIWIFLLEKNGIPLYTIETDLKDYFIKQIVSQCNGHVDDGGKKIAQKLIHKAVGHEQN